MPIMFLMSGQAGSSVDTSVSCLVEFRECCMRCNNSAPVQVCVYCTVVVIVHSMSTVDQQ